jgi:hypothetical protein
MHTVYKFIITEFTLSQFINQLYLTTGNPSVFRFGIWKELGQFIIGDICLQFPLLFSFVGHRPYRIGLLDKPPAGSAFLPSRASSRIRFPTFLAPQPQYEVI